jgi:cell division septation protein DedD
VALGIIFIPWLLDGPAQAPRAVEKPLELPPASAPGKSYAIPLDPAAGRPVQIGEAEAEPEPQAAGAPEGMIQRPALEDPVPVPAREEEQPSQPPPRPSPQPSQPTPAPATTTPAAESWAVQVGSFSQTDNAEALRRKLTGAGFEAFVSRVATDAGTMHRVRVGPVGDRAEADRLLVRLREAGHGGARVVRAED